MNPVTALLIVLGLIFGGSTLAVILIIVFSGRAATASCLPEIIANLEESLRGLPFETEYILDQEGKIIFQQTQYNQKFVEFSDEQIQYLQQHPGSISLHNHDTDTPPSCTDLAFAALTAQSFLLVISPHFRYIVSPGPTGWKDSTALDQAFNKHRHLFKVVDLPGERVVGIDNDGALVTETLIEVESTDAAIEAVTQELGYCYRKDVLSA